MSPSDRAYVSAYDRIQKELREEIEQLRGLRLRIDEDIRRLEAMLETRIAEQDQSAEDMSHANGVNSLAGPVGDRAGSLVGHSAEHGPSSAARVVRRAWEILSQHPGGMSRGELFEAVQASGLVVPGSNAVKNFGNLLARSNLISKAEGRYVAASADPSIEG